MRHLTLRPLLVLAAVALSAAPSSAGDGRVTVGGTVYASQGLVGVGRIPAALRDSFGETFGSGSSMALVPSSWHRTETGYAGSLLLLPDRGYNVEGTADYRARVSLPTLAQRAPSRF